MQRQSLINKIQDSRKFEYVYTLKSRYNNSIELISNSDKIFGKDCVILVHGFYTDCDSLPIGQLYNYLSSDWSVFKFNVIGKGGEYPSYSEYISDIFDVVMYISTLKPKSISLLGHSMGAAASLICANKLQNYKLINKLILLGMPENTTGFFERYKVAPIKPEDKKKKAVILGKSVYIPKEFLVDLFRYNIPEEVMNLKTPVSYIYGENDKVILRNKIHDIYKMTFSTDETKKLRRRKKLILIPSTGHLFRGSKAQKNLFSNISSILLHNYEK